MPTVDAIYIDKMYLYGKELTVLIRINIFILELYIQELGRIIDKLSYSPFFPFS